MTRVCPILAQRFEVVVLNKDGVETRRESMGTRQGAFKAAMTSAYGARRAYCVIDGRMTVFRHHEVVFPVPDKAQLVFGL